MHRTFSNRRGSALLIRRNAQDIFKQTRISTCSTTVRKRKNPKSSTYITANGLFSKLMCLFKEVCLLLWMMSARSTHRLQACHDFNLLNAQHCDSADVHQESIFEMSGFVRFVWFLCLLRCFLTANVILAEGDCFHLTTDGSIARSC